MRARYLFSEGNGNLAKDASRNGHHLIIPAIFQPIHRQFLIAPWKDVSYQGWDYSDIVINILGFMPFGFCFFLYRHSIIPNRGIANILSVVLAGAAVSLTIEIIQAWRPNRLSSSMDLLTNTTGTLLGLMLAMVIRRKFNW